MNILSKLTQTSFKESDVTSIIVNNLSNQTLVEYLARPKLKECMINIANGDFIAATKAYKDRTDTSLR